MLIVLGGYVAIGVFCAFGMARDATFFMRLAIVVLWLPMLCLWLVQILTETHDGSNAVSMPTLVYYEDECQNDD